MHSDLDPRTSRLAFGGWRWGVVYLIGLLIVVPTLSAQGTADPALDEARAKATARLAAAERTQAEAEQLRQHQDFSLASSRDANLDSTWQRAEQLLQTARDALKSAQGTPSANSFRDAGILANGSRRAFEDFAGRAQRVLRSIEQERAPPPPKPAPPPPPPREPDPEPPSPAEDAGPISDNTAVAVAPQGSTSPTPSSTTATPEGSPPRPTTKPPRLTSAAPPLKRAIEAFFKGDDAQVLVALDNITSLGSGEQKAHALLFRAAARYHLYLLGGERDFAQRSAAVEDVLSCRRLSPELKPRADLFSPRFVDFFNGTR